MYHKVVISNFVIASSQQMHLFVMELIETLLDIITKLIEGSMKSGVTFLSTWDSLTCFGTGTHDLQII